MPETALTLEETLAALRDAIAAAGSARAWATGHGISAQYVADVLAGRRQPSDRILGPLGLCRVTLIVPAPTKKESLS
ncbi:MAG: hypothetical protein K2Z25_19300 [Beijerinckiaceae bacterium]|nr:hypothetical protein [Beijerinckiaceae bacterium]